MSEDKPHHELIMRMLAAAEWEKARGHLRAMLQLEYYEHRHPIGSAADANDEGTQRVRAMFEKVEEFIVEMDEYHG